jgi:hypothetical protein
MKKVKRLKSEEEEGDMDEEKEGGRGEDNL